MRLVKQAIKNTIRQPLTKAAIPVLQAIVRSTPPSRLRWLAWKLGNSPLLSSVEFVTEANGVVFAGNTRDLIQGYLYWFGVWEPNLTDFITRRMGEAPNRVFVDIGANIGYFSVLVATRNPTATVVAIEAFPRTVARLRSNLERNGVKNVRISEVAASDSQGTVDFFYAGPWNEGATTTKEGRFQAEPVTVTCKPLSELLSDGEIAAARLIKIDVEGAESRVIKGMASILSGMPEDVEVIVEVSGDHIERQLIFDTFTASDFHAYEIDNDYRVTSYLYPQVLKRPTRLRAIPSSQTDVVFSRLDADYL